MESEVIDVDMDYEVPIAKATPAPSLRRQATPHHRAAVDGVFSKRPPASPLPAASPRKARPPARTTRTMPPPPPRVPDDEEEDPLSLRFTSPEIEPVAIVATTAPRRSNGSARRRGNQTRAEGSAALRGESVTSASAASHSSSRQPNSGGKRRQTLDEELRHARKRSIMSEADGEEEEDGDEEEEEEEDLDSGILVGVGTRSKTRGFLAHGGAGGAPVFMGEGYIEGVDLDDQEDVIEEHKDDADYQPSKPVRNSVSGGRARKGKR